MKKPVLLFILIFLSTLVIIQNLPMENQQDNYRKLWNKCNQKRDDAIMNGFFYALSGSVSGCGISFSRKKSTPIFLNTVGIISLVGIGYYSYKTIALTKKLQGLDSREFKKRINALEDALDKQFK